MSVLGDAFREAEANRQDAIFGKWLGDVVALALAPFKPGAISLELSQDENLFEFGRTLRVDVDIVSNYPFKYKFDEWAAHRAIYPDDYLRDTIARPLFNHFRHRPALPVDDHIILGEE